MNSLHKTVTRQRRDCDLNRYRDISFPCTFVPGNETTTQWTFIPGNDVSNMLSPVCRHASHQLESGHFWSSSSSLVPKLELGLYRFFKSRYRFSVLWSVFQKSVAVSVSVFQNIAISVSVFGFSARTYRCLSNNTIADTLRPPLPPKWGLGPRITNCGHKR